MNQISKGKIKSISYTSVLIFLIFGLWACGTTSEKKDSSNNELTQDTLVYDTGPRWSLTGEEILFYTYRHDPEGAELYSVKPDGTNLRRLTDTYHNEWWSDFSKNGNKVYVSSDYGKSKRFGGSEIFELQNNSKLERLTFNKDSTSFNIYPRVSPNGKQLLYCFDCLGSDNNSEVYLVDLEGNSSINLTNNPSADSYGSWGPNGRQIVFNSNRNGNYEIYSMNLKSKELINLSNNNADDIHADWSIHNKIVFVSDRDGDDEIFVMDADGSNVQQLTFNNDNDVLPCWSPNGRKIAFSSYRYGKKDKGDIFVINRDGTNEHRVTKR